MNHIRFIGLKNFPDRLLRRATTSPTYTLNTFRGKTFPSLGIRRRCRVGLGVSKAFCSISGLLISQIGGGPANELMKMPVDCLVTFAATVLPDAASGALFSYVDMEARGPATHPLRTIRTIVNEVMAALDTEFEALYEGIGRQSVAPERLLRASLLISCW